jgi:alpha-glucosidase
METTKHNDGDLAVGLDFDDPANALTVTRAGETVINASPIGIDTPDGRFPTAYDLVGSDSTTIDNRFSLPTGKRRDHHHRATQTTFRFESENEREVDFEVRVAPDGIAYRYRIGGDGAFLLSNEYSGFRPPSGAVAWLFEHDRDHESVGKHYTSGLANGEFTMPGLFETQNGWVLATEAGVDSRYAASRLVSTEGDPTFNFRLPNITVNFGLPGTTPWRVAVVGDRSTVVESTLVWELAGGEPSGTDWIEPGRVAWSWWGDNDSSTEYATQKEYVDYAAERGWEYVLVDEGWDPEWIPDLVEYADGRGIGILLWAHWTDLHSAIDRDRRLDRWAAWGVEGIKVDFMDSDDQGILQFYDDLCAAAVERELLVNFHGSVVPTGLAKRWPHVMSYEGVKGAEHYQWTGLPPEHNTILPFTRNAIGPMDYTPVTFSAPGRFTSAGHELALAIVFESGLQHYADDIEEYAARPAAEWVLERVPSMWDETRLLGGRPGTEATLARRHGDDWFVGSITAGPARTIDVPLNFLDTERDAQLVRDGTDDSLAKEHQHLSPDEVQRVDVAANGGFCLIAPASPE